MSPEVSLAGAEIALCLYWTSETILKIMIWNHAQACLVVWRYAASSSVDLVYDTVSFDFFKLLIYWAKWMKRCMFAVNRYIMIRLGKKYSTHLISRTSVGTQWYCESLIEFSLLSVRGWISFSLPVVSMRQGQLLFLFCSHGQDCSYRKSLSAEFQMNRTKPGFQTGLVYSTYRQWICLPAQQDLQRETAANSNLF